jgi:hypothetical protein
MGGCELAESSGGTLTESDTTCPTGVAQVEIADSYLRILCGCAEARGTLSAPPGTLTCTVPAGTVVNFLFSSTDHDHQLIPEDPGSELKPSGVNPGIHTVRLDTAGTFPFKDAYYPALSGNIVVY